MDKEEEAKTEAAFITVMNSLASYIEGEGFALPKNEITALDFGSGLMPYGNALERWALSRAERAKIVAVDTGYADASFIFIPANRGNKGIEKIPSIEMALKKFEKPDIVTMFHPDESLITASVGCLEKLCNSPILGAIFLSDLWMDFKNGLESKGYSLKLFSNPRSKELSEGFVLPYSLLFAALPSNKLRERNVGITG